MKPNLLVLGERDLSSILSTAAGQNLTNATHIIQSMQTVTVPEVGGGDRRDAS